MQVRKRNSSVCFLRDCQSRHNYSGCLLTAEKNRHQQSVIGLPSSCRWRRTKYTVPEKPCRPLALSSIMLPSKCNLVAQLRLKLWNNKALPIIDPCLYYLYIGEAVWKLESCWCCFIENSGWVCWNPVCDQVDNLPISKYLDIMQGVSKNTLVTRQDKGKMSNININVNY